MANREHLAVVRQGPEEVAVYRLRYPNEVFDLTGADLPDVDLAGADLSGANLRGAVLRDGALRGVSLARADLTGADLSRANLSQADSDYAVFTAAVLTGANLSESRLLGASMAFADLGDATLNGTVLVLANLHHAGLLGTDFTGAVLGSTALGNVDLGVAIGLERATHVAPSVLGVATLERTLPGSGGRPSSQVLTFLQGAGVNAGLLGRLPALLEEQRGRRCLLVHGEADRAFAERLYGDLWAAGVSCWVYPAELARSPDVALNREETDWIVLLCSAAGLAPTTVREEVEELLESPSKLLPVSLESSWRAPGYGITGRRRQIKEHLLAKLAAEFETEGQYGENLDRVVGAVGKPPG